MDKTTLLISISPKLLERLNLIATKKNLGLNAVVEEGLKQCVNREISLVKIYEKLGDKKNGKKN